MAAFTHTRRTRLAAGAIGTLAWAGVFVALVFTPDWNVSTVTEALGALITFTAFFTIWTNTLVALALTVPLVAPDSRLGRFFRRPGVIAGVAASIAFVSLGYDLLLRGARDLSAAALALDLVLHYVVPILFVGYWLAVAPKDGLQWRDPLFWLSYPLAYAVHVFVRGELAGFYPYPFFDVPEFGYASVLGNTFGLGIAFVVLGLVFVAVGRLQERIAEEKPAEEEPAR